MNSKTLEHASVGTAVPVAARAVGLRTDHPLHAQLLRVTSGTDDPDHVRADVRRIIKDATSASVTVHLLPDGDGRFAVSSERAEGSFPNGEICTQIQETGSLSIARNATQIKRVEDGGQQIVCVPIHGAGAQPEVLGAVLTSKLSNLHSALFTLELAASYQRLWARGHVAAANQWKLNSLAAIVELVTHIEQQESFEGAINVATNSVAKFLGCARVAFAELTPRGGMRLRDISGFDGFDETSETSRAYREALAETQLHCDMVRWPASPAGQRSALLAHTTLGQLCHFRSICSATLQTPEGEIVGAWLLADSDELATDERFGNFVRAASPRIASALAVSRKRHQPLVRRAYESAASFARSNSARIVLLACILIVGLLLLPVPYRIRCRCSVEPNSRRYAVAPFGGIVEETGVEPGDVVAAGDLLARMDGREILWDLSAAEAERSQAVKQRDVDLAEREVTKVLISQFETERLDAKIDVLQFRRDNLDVRSAIDGVVLSGSLEKSQSAPVDVGQVLYEIGPLDDLKVEIEVPDIDVAQVQEGQCVKVWIDGLEGVPIEAIIDRIAPRSEVRNDRNVFIAKVALANPDLRFRPGMRGSARISGPLRPLAWNVFHKPWDFVVSRLTWW